MSISWIKEEVDCNCFSVTRVLYLGKKKKATVDLAFLYYMLERLSHLTYISLGVRA